MRKAGGKPAFFVFAKRRYAPQSVLAQQLVDAALELALLLLAPAQPGIDIVRRRVRHNIAKGEADPVGLAPDHPGEVAASPVLDGQLDLVGKVGGSVELNAGATVAEIAHHAIHRRADFPDFRHGPEKHLVAHVLSSVLHRPAPENDSRILSGFDAERRVWKLPKSR